MELTCIYLLLPNTLTLDRKIDEGEGMGSSGKGTREKFGRHEQERGWETRTEFGTPHQPATEIDNSILHLINLSII